MMRWPAKGRDTSRAGGKGTDARTTTSITALIVRNTSPYPTIRVESLLNFAFDGILHAGIEVHVKGSSRTYRGRAYDGIPRMANVSDSACYLVSIGLSRVKSRLPLRVTLGTKLLQRKYPDGVPVDDWEDVLVYVAAHEARHIWQFQARRQKRKMALSEVDADTYAIYQMNEWRRMSGRDLFKIQI
jgi:hypothetical protein